ncbi:MAG TPA: PspC domain-containing protein [Candidatus Hydrogenedentes bacterium]|nr:PspC domain-containing protein [Candidatus Hydrogenedentota bacterium]
MKLAQKQLLLVEQYLRAVALELTEVPEDERDAIIRRLKARIGKELQAAEVDLPDDEDVRRVLRRFGAPCDLAEEVLRQRRGTAPPVEQRCRTPQVAPDAQWLGICSHFARRFGADPSVVRLVAVLLGLLTGPVAVLLYLAAYFEVYVTSEPEALPRIEPGKLAKYVIGTLAAATGLHAGARFVYAMMTHAYCAYTGEVAPVLGKWDWLDVHAQGLFVGVLIVFAPLATVGGLPVANNWDATLKRAIQAGLAVYALVLCAGLGAALAGHLLLVIENFSL